MNKPQKCKSCGRVISSDPSSISYSPNPNAKYCLRCWNLKQYQKNSYQDLATTIANKNVQELKIGDDDLIVLINDLLNINFDLIKKYQNHLHKILVFNKIDLVLNQHNYSIIKHNIEGLLYSWNYPKTEIILTSAKTNYGIRNLNNVIIHQKLKTKIYFIGDTNAGKSSIINRLLNFNELKNKELTISPYLNTTIDFKKFKILKHSVIDCPGSNDASNIILQINEFNSKLIQSHKCNSSHYLVKKEQYFHFDNLGYIKITPLKNTSISFYLSLNIVPTRSKLKQPKNKFKLCLNDNTKWKTNTINNPNKIIAIQVSGLGHIYIENAKMIEYSFPERSRINLCNSRIC